MPSGWKNCCWRVRKFLALLALATLFAGCVTDRMLELDAKHPSIEVKTTGFYVNGQPASARYILESLQDLEVPVTRVIHIRVDNDVTDLKPARMLMAYLAQNGYTRPVLVTERHAESAVKERSNPWR